LFDPFKSRRQLLLLMMFFWLAYYFIVSLTNLFALLKAAHCLPATWSFASTNFDEMIRVISRYHFGKSSAVFLLGLATCAEGLLFLVFLIALFKRKARPSLTGVAFLAGTAYWALFIIIDEIFIAYFDESAHVKLLILSLLSCFLYFSALSHGEKGGSR